MVNELATDFAGLRLTNPFIVGACPCTADSKHIIAAANAGWGGAVTKTITSHPPYVKNLTPYQISIREGRKLIGLANNEIKTELGIDQWCDVEIPAVKSVVQEPFVLIASIMEGADPQHWAETARRLEGAGSDAIELNISCTHGMPIKKMGKYINDSPDLLEQIVFACKSHVRIPVIVKISADAEIASTVQACINGGADAISTTNTLPCLAPIDPEIDSDFQDQAATITEMGYSGPGIRPIALHYVAELVRQTTLPVCGIGGIADWSHAVEYLLLGASAVQVATAVMLEGFTMVNRLKIGLHQTLKRRKQTSVTSLRGKALRFLMSIDSAISQSALATAEIEMRKCTLCDKCLISCRDGATGAIRRTVDIFHVDTSTCTGCGLCIAVCPTAAIRMV